MTALVEQDPVLVEVLRTTLEGEVTVLSSVAALEGHLERHPQEYAAVLGPGVALAEAAAFAGRNRISRPALGVILVRPAVEPSVLTDALRSGMSEVVETSDAGALREAVRRAAEVGRAMAEGLEQATAAEVGSLLTVFSTKGGVGKSMVATNLAAALADAGRRVCLVDLDVHCGDVAIMLQLTPQHSLADLGRLSGAIDDSGVQSLLIEHSDRLWVLAAPVQLDAEVPSEPIGQVLETLKGLFDAVVVDTSGVFDDHVLAALDRSDLVVLVGTLDIPSLKSLKLAAGTLELLDIPRDRWRLVLNRADSRVGLSTQEFESTMDLKASVSLPSSRDVLAAVNRGETIVRSSRNHAVSKSLIAFARSLEEATRAPEHMRDGGNPTTHRNGQRRSLRFRKAA